MINSTVAKLGQTTVLCVGPYTMASRGQGHPPSFQTLVVTGCCFAVSAGTLSLPDLLSALWSREVKNLQALALHLFLSSSRSCLQHSLSFHLFSKASAHLVFSCHPRHLFLLSSPLLPHRRRTRGASFIVHRVPAMPCSPL